MKKEARLAVLYRCSNLLLLYVFRGCTRLEKLLIASNVNDLIEELKLSNLIGEVNLFTSYNDSTTLKELLHMITTELRARVNVVAAPVHPYCRSRKEFEHLMQSGCESLKPLLKTTLSI